MPANQVQRRRGTATQCNAMVPAAAEVIVDTTNNRQRIGDGVKTGGHIVPNAYDMQIQPFINGTVGGTGNAITITLDPPLGSYTDFQTVRFKATATNTGATTINIDGNGVIDVVKIVNGASSGLAAGDIVNGGIYEGVLNGGDFQLLTLIEGGLITVSQGDLNTSTGTVTVASLGTGAWFTILSGNVFPLTSSYVTSVGAAKYESGAVTVSSNVILPGGEYGFYPQVNKSGSGSGSLGAKQRYVLSSPPYDLGEGEVGGFFFALVDNDGNIKSHYLADTPPWAYNGPTDIRCTHKCPVTGKKYRKVMKGRTIEQIMDGAAAKYEMQELTQDIKNKDMGLIPHPFGGDLNGCHVVLLDPMDDSIRKLVEYQNMGGDMDVVQAIHSGKFTVDNIAMKRKGPKGVAIHKMKYKFTKKF